MLASRRGGTRCQQQPIETLREVPDGLWERIEPMSNPFLPVSQLMLRWTLAERERLA